MTACPQTAPAAAGAIAVPIAVRVIMPALQPRDRALIVAVLDRFPGARIVDVQIAQTSAAEA